MKKINSRRITTKYHITFFRQMLDNLSNKEVYLLLQEYKKGLFEVEL